MANPLYVTDGLMWRFSNAMTWAGRVAVQTIEWHGAAAAASNSLFDGLGNKVFTGIGTSDKIWFSHPRVYKGLSVPALSANQYFDVWIV